MSDMFNPYHRWLGIPPKYQPLDHYRLLGVELFESDLEVIRDASERQISHVRRYANGEHAGTANHLLNELATARACLLNSASKLDYDQQVGAQLQAQNPPPVASPLTVTTSVAKHSVRIRPRNTWGNVAKIAVGGIAGLAIGVLLLWYGFGMDVFGVMESRDEGTAKQIAQNDTTVQAKPPHKRDTRQESNLELTQPPPGVRSEQLAEPEENENLVPSVPIPDNTTEGDARICFIARSTTVGEPRTTARSCSVQCGTSARAPASVGRLSGCTS
ncbi:MAG: hypothetical protein H8E66_13860 [Planctomycetes bacterium]|nr:hypothetical protein [Planctomycetota bacterium]